MTKIMPIFIHVLVTLLILVAGSSFANAERPNVIVIMADDLGYGDVSCYGATAFETPHIDALAAEGLRFTSGYCSASTCTPTRFSLLTGTYAFRYPGTGIAPPASPLIIPPETTTLADLLKQAGYQTAVVGKWHLGLGTEEEGPQWNGMLKPGPLELGFDFSFLLPTTNDRVPQVFVRNHRVLDLDPSDPLWVGEERPNDDHPTGERHRESLKMNWSHGHHDTIHNGISRIGFYTGGHAARFRDEDLADRWVEESNRWIEQHRDEPFFLFFASHDNHVPRIPHERFQGATGLGPRADAIVQLDWCVGELMRTLDRLGIADDTLVVFCSDNGPVMDDGYEDFALEMRGHHRAAGPFRGGKYSIYEGGTRTPFITRWPGRIEPGVSDQIVCTIDLAASLAGLTGVDLPSEACRDSFDVMGALLGEHGALGREHLVQQDNGKGGNYGFRVGNWKLHRHDSKRTRNLVVEQPLENTPVPRFQLFDLASDPTESVNVANEHPEVVEQMKQRLEHLIEVGRSRP